LRTIEREQRKYDKAFKTIPEYKDLSPGKMFWHIFQEEMDPQPGKSIIDLGCGRGLVAKDMADAGLQITQLDIKDYREEGPFQTRFDFIESALWSQWEHPDCSTGMHAQWDYGFCCDVMEHIPTEYTMLALKRIIQNTKQCFFLISCIEDIHGKQIGESLHLTIRDFTWWLNRLNEFGTVTHARDVIASGVYVVE
jgi:2-polyprenyl-3-methyl-5-hydroxy-6-metoxy-1,4-benzoquinol methylase